MRRIVIISSISIAWGFILLIDLAPILRGGYGWRWPYALPNDIGDSFALLLMLTISLIGSIVFVRRSASTLILWVIFLGIGLSLASLYVREKNVYIELYRRTISSGATGWHYASTDIDDLNDDLGAWPSFMASYKSQSSHMTTSPPGLPLLYYSNQQIAERLDFLSEAIAPPLRADQCHNDRIVGWSLYPGYSNAELASAWFGILMPLWGSLIVIPLYTAGKFFYGKESARWAVVWWPLVPSFLMFSPNPTPIYAGLALTVIYLLGRALESSRALVLLLAGMVMSIGTFLHFTVLPIIFLAGLYTLAYHYFICRDRGRWWSVRAGLWFGLGLSTIWLIYWLLSGVTVIEIINQAFDSHLSLDRPYLPWLWLHLNDFFMFTGWPLSLLALLGIASTLFRLWTHKQTKDRGTLLTGAVFLTLLVMDISGTTQGESGRIWLFMSPFVLLIAARTLETTTQEPESAGTLLTFSQAICVFIMICTMPVLESGLDSPPKEPPDVLESQSILISTQATYAGTIQLRGFSGYISEGKLHVWIQWRSEGQVPTPYYIDLLPVSPEGETLRSLTTQPFASEPYPTTCWTPENGNIVTYHEIDLMNIEDAGGEWWLSVALFDRKGNAASVTLADGSDDQQTGIGPFQRRE